MPLRALLDGTTIFAFEQTEESWAALKNSPEKKRLSMPCCGERAIAKISPLGNYFFAHSRKAEHCCSKPESKEHIFLKGVIAKAAKSANWDVTTEHIGSSPDGNKWIADVFCKKNTQVAFEVQLSKQTLKEFSLRQDRYKNSGVRTAWFVSESVATSIRHPQSKELPIFTVGNYAKAQSVPIAFSFNIPLDEFVQALLSGSVTWKEDQEELNIHYIHDKCWSCGSAVKQPYGYSIDVYYDFVKTVPNCSNVLKDILDYVGNEALSSREINKIASHPKFKGNAPGFPYCAECIHCGQPQANHYLIEKLKSDRNNETYVDYVESFIVGACNGRWEYVY